MGRQVDRWAVGSYICMVQPISHEALGDEIVRVVKLLHAARAQAPPPAGLDHSAYPILFGLAREPHRVSDLAEAIHSDVSTVSRQVAGLVRGGYVDRTPDPDDGRAQVLTLSAAGRRVIREARQRREAWLSELLADWPADEISTFTTLLGKFAGTLQNRSITPKDPTA